MTNIDRADQVMEGACCGGCCGSCDFPRLARALADAGLLMPDDVSTQTETVGPHFPEGEEKPDLPEGTDVTRIVGPWEEA